MSGWNRRIDRITPRRAPVYLKPSGFCDSIANSTLPKNNFRGYISPGHETLEPCIGNAEPVRSEWGPITTKNPWDLCCDCV